MSPISLLATWVSKEQQAGAPNPQQAVLSTCGLEAIAHARVVAIRELSDKKKQIEQTYADKVLPLSPYYRGCRLHPERFMFYAFRTDELSDVFEYRKHPSAWVKQWLSP